MSDVLAFDGTRRRAPRFGADVAMPAEHAPRGRSLLRTKLFVPRARAGCVARPRLHARLDVGVAGPITLVCAAAGWGKTTLVADWLHATARRPAWLSLDEGDADPLRLVAYVVAALRDLHPGLMTSFDPWGPEPVDPQVAITELVNELAELAGDFILVLDDLHHVESPPAHALLGFFLDAAPPNLHVVITTRVDPPLPLARWRARGQLVEIRAPDLRFSEPEMQRFFSHTMGLELPEDALRKLDGRTEGWAAGLQMAALSLRGHADPAAFIESFAGSHRFVLDYLMEEVLAKMEPARREALLRLSILRELSGSIVDALLGGNEGSCCSSRSRTKTCFSSRSTTPGARTDFITYSARCCDTSSPERSDTTRAATCMCAPPLRSRPPMRSTRRSITRSRPRTGIAPSGCSCATPT